MPRSVAAWVLLLLVAALSWASTGSAQSRRKVHAGREETGFETADADLIARIDADLAELEGKPIRAIRVETVGKRWPSKPEVRSLRLGEPLSGRAVRRAVRELLETGGFAQARAEAEPQGDGVLLRIYLVPRRVIAGIRVVGGVLEQGQLLNAIELAEGDAISEPTIAQIAGRIREVHRGFGYDRAEVKIDVRDTDDPSKVLLNIDIDAGDQRTISRRIFVIEPRYDRVIGDRKSEYAVEAGDPVEEDALVEADNELVETLRTDGFIDASVKHRVVRQKENTFLYVYLETGPLYRFVFQGNVKYDDDELEEALGLDSASVDASPEALADKLRDFYRRRGFLDVRVEPTVEELSSGAIHEIRFRVIEGRVVRVLRRMYPCLRENGPEGLRPGDIDDELDAFLEDDLPDMPLFHQVEEAVIDSTFSSVGGGSRAEPRRLEPAKTYTPDAYKRAMEHLEKLLHAKGYLNAKIGPAQPIRAECDPGARGGRCVPLALPKYPRPRCQKDPLELPIAEQPLPETFTCVPDPKRSIHCSPNITMHIPIQLGPQMRLWDVVFEGNSQVSSPELMYLLRMKSADVAPPSLDRDDQRGEIFERLRDLAEDKEETPFDLGEPFSNVGLDAARQHIIDLYRDLGFAYASVRTEMVTSPDRTRARARFIISEHEPVVISGYEVRGALRTDHDLILRRLALCQDLDACKPEEKYYRQYLVRQSEEQIATLGTFSSVAIALEDPEIPEKRKRVIINVVEQRSQYIEPRVGFSTGEGFRVAFEYGHRNIAGQAIGLTIRLEFSYLPEFLILDDDVRANYEEFTVSERLERRNSASLRFPEVGLGPRVDLVVDAIDVRDNQRDFGLTRDALIPTFGWRPIRTLTNQLGFSGERNDVTLFNAEDIQGAIRDNPALANLLRVPEGPTAAFAQRVGVTWDRRDNPLAATSGTLLSLGIEHVTALPLEPLTPEQDEARLAALPDGCTAPEAVSSEFLKFTGRTAGYIRLTDAGMAIAISVAAGYNLQLTCWSQTYPDRLFYLGGVNTVRGFQLDEMVPEDLAQKVLDGELTIDEIGIRGGNLSINPRAELRIPLTDIFSIGVFLDTGNVWTSAESLGSGAEVIENLLKLR
ncbi:MAG TPA: POTRA domain-containing protein, partial [Polyangiaceae bacterium]|nr:POTRA domain-containing protein [Polyangiaceae bacterium]